MFATPTLTTDRLILRPLRHVDGAALFEAYRDSHVMAWWDWPAHETMAETQRLIGYEIESAEEGEAFQWAIVDRADDRVIGTCDLSDWSVHHRRAEIGFLLLRRAQGYGYMNEVMPALIEFAFGTLELHRISARAHAENAVSIRLLEKFGFQHEGVLRGSVWRDGAPRDCVLMARVA